MNGLSMAKEFYGITKQGRDIERNIAINRFTYSLYVIGLADEGDVEEKFLAMMKWANAVKEVRENAKQTWVTKIVEQ